MTHQHKRSLSTAQLTSAYNELGRQLNQSQLSTVGTYTLGRIIGEGSFGKVRLATHRLTGVRCAIKQVPRSHAPPLLIREIHHHRRLHHPHILQLYEVIPTESNIWLVTELCPGGELFDYLVERGRLPNDEARILLGQLCLALNHLHSLSIVHRDIKLENILLDEHCNIKLADFGFGRECERNRLLETWCGTTVYCSPEMLSQTKYTGQETDVWSLGVILYALLTGALPFDDDDEAVVRSRVLSVKYHIPDFMDPAAADLIQHILKREPDQRLSIKQILSHHWFTGRSTSIPTTNDPVSSPSVFVSSPATQNQPSAVNINTNTNINTNLTNDDDRETNTTLSPKTGSEPDLLSCKSTPPTSEDDSSPVLLSANEQQFTTITNHTVNNEDDSVSRRESQSTIKTAFTSNTLLLPNQQQRQQQQQQQSDTHGSQISDDDTFVSATNESKLSLDPSPIQQQQQQQTLRTPSRTKKRNSRPSSLLNYQDASSEQQQQSNSPCPSPNSPSSTNSRPQSISGGTTNSPYPDFLSKLNDPQPPPLSTEFEQNLLKSLSSIGFDTGQMMHSVKVDACDSASATWWMLIRKNQERQQEQLEISQNTVTSSTLTNTDVPKISSLTFTQPNKPQPQPQLPSQAQAQSQSQAQESSSSNKASQMIILGKLNQDNSHQPDTTQNKMGRERSTSVPVDLNQQYDTDTDTDKNNGKHDYNHDTPKSKGRKERPESPLRSVITNNTLSDNGPNSKEHDSKEDNKTNNKSSKMAVNYDARPYTAPETKPSNETWKTGLQIPSSPSKQQRKNEKTGSSAVGIFNRSSKHTASLSTSSSPLTANVTNTNSTISPVHDNDTFGGGVNDASHDNNDKDNTSKQQQKNNNKKNDAPAHLTKPRPANSSSNNNNNSKNNSKNRGKNNLGLFSSFKSWFNEDRRRKKRDQQQQQHHLQKQQKSSDVSFPNNPKNQQLDGNLAPRRSISQQQLPPRLSASRRRPSSVYSHHRKLSQKGRHRRHLSDSSRGSRTPSESSRPASYYESFYNQPLNANGSNVSGVGGSISGNNNNTNNNSAVSTSSINNRRHRRNASISSTGSKSSGTYRRTPSSTQVRRISTSSFNRTVTNSSNKSNTNNTCSPSSISSNTMNVNSSHNNNNNNNTNNSLNRSNSTFRTSMDIATPSPENNNTPSDTNDTTPKVGLGIVKHPSTTSWSQSSEHEDVITDESQQQHQQHQQHQQYLQHHHDTITEESETFHQDHHSQESDYQTSSNELELPLTDEVYDKSDTGSVATSLEILGGKSKKLGSESGGNSIASSQQTIFTAHKSVNLFGPPNNNRKSLQQPKKQLRNVFSNDSGGDWIDENDDQEYASGFGQAPSTSSRPFSPSSFSDEMTSPNSNVAYDRMPTTVSSSNNTTRDRTAKSAMMRGETTVIQEEEEDESDDW